MPLNHRALPGLEHDRALVLASRPVLGQQAGPVLPGHRADDAPLHQACMWTTARPDLSHQFEDVTVQLHVAGVVVDVEVPHLTPTRRDVSITEIPAKQLDVGPLVQRGVRATRARDRCVHLTTRQPPPLIETSPTSDRLDCDPVPGRVVHVGHARIRCGQRAGHHPGGANVIHEVRVANATDSGAGCGI